MLLITICWRRLRRVSAGACRRRVNGAKLGGGVMWHPLCGRVLTLHLCVSLCVCVCVCVCARSDSPAVWLIRPHPRMCTHRNTLHSALTGTHTHTHTHTHKHKHSVLPPTQHICVVVRPFTTLAPCVFVFFKKTERWHYVICGADGLFVLFLHCNMKSAAVMETICWDLGQRRGQDLFGNAFAVFLSCWYWQHSPLLCSRCAYLTKVW